MSLLMGHVCFAGQGGLGTEMAASAIASADAGGSGTASGPASAGEGTAAGQSDRNVSSPNVSSSKPVAVLAAQGVLPATPPTPVGAASLMTLLWGPYRRSETQEATKQTPAPQQQTALAEPCASETGSAAAPVAQMAMASTLAAPSTSGASVDYQVTNDWGSGYIANVNVTAGPSALNGWTVEFDFPNEIIGIWNAELVSRTETHYVVRNADWNAQLGAGESASFGFQANTGGALPVGAKAV
jgi:cellulase/cellobiase CelA1